MNFNVFSNVYWFLIIVYAGMFLTSGTGYRAMIASIPFGKGHLANPFVTILAFLGIALTISVIWQWK